MIKQIAYVVLAVGLAAVIAGLVMLRSSASRAASVPQQPQGHDEALPGGLLINGFLVANIGECRMLEFYRQAEYLLGPPIGSFTGRSQDFWFGRAQCLDGRPPVLDDLGLKYLILQGTTPQPGSEMAPLVRSYVLAALEGGVDPNHFFGRIISEPICRKGRCTQVADKATFAWEAQPDTTVKQLPVGCFLNHACSPLQASVGQSPSRRFPMALLAGGGTLSLVALVLLFASPGQERFGRRVITG